jgi:Rad51
VIDTEGTFRPERLDPLMNQLYPRYTCNRKLMMLCALSSVLFLATDTRTTFFFVILCSIAGIAERYGLEPEACLENIVYARAYTHEHMFTLLTEGSFCVCTRARIRAEIEYKYIYVCSRLCVSRFV